MNKSKKQALWLAWGGCFLASAVAASAVGISYDETLFQASTGDPSQLSANVGMVLSGSTLYITLQNVSGAAAADPNALAASMISGIALNLPAGVTVTGGSISPDGTPSPKAWNLTTANQQWGYANDGTGGSLNHAALSYNAEASTMSSEVSTAFVGGGGVGGLNYGAVAFGIKPPGSPSVVDTLNLDLNLSGDLTGLIPYIDQHPVAVIFGSADSTSVPDSGTTLALLGVGVVGLVGFGRSSKQ